MLVKRHNALSVDGSEPRKFETVSLRQCQMWLLRVCYNCIPGCVLRECYIFPRAHSSGVTCKIPTWADTLLVTYRGIPRARNYDE